MNEKNEHIVHSEEKTMQTFPVQASPTFDRKSPSTSNNAVTLLRKQIIEKKKDELTVFFGFSRKMRIKMKKNSASKRKEGRGNTVQRS